jgi:REP element-mobilizing transposase RayT
MSGYDPKVHHRRSIRLNEYDYSQNGAYFVTICIHDRQNLFGRIEEGKMTTNRYGDMADQEWRKLEQRFPHASFDVFQIMPNHIHGIIAVGATLAVASNRAGASPAPTVGNIIGAYKSLVANECRRICDLQGVVLGKLWQRGYYDHVIRDEKDYLRIAEYIQNNPLKWELDEYYV